MATTYIFRFADGTKDTFLVAPFTANGFESPDSPIFMPQAGGQANTDLQLYGQGMPDYGQGIEQGIIYILENFANSTPPQNPIEGQNWFNNATKELFIHDGSAWGATILASGVSPMTGDLNMGVGSPLTNRIINLGDPTNPQDAVTLSYADATYFNVIGDTITGDLTVLGDVLITMGSPPTGNAAISKDYADSTYLALAGGIMTGTIQLPSGAPSNVLGAVSQQYGDSRYLRLSGDTMTGILTLFADPTANLDAATKQYVDTEIISATDSVLTNITFISAPTGSPPNPVSATGNTMVFQRSGGLPDIEVVGLDYIGKIKAANEISLTATGGTDVTAIEVQAGISQLDINKLSILGGSLSGDLDMTSNNINGLITPTVDDQAASKGYVDSVLLKDVYNDIFLTDGSSTLYGTPGNKAGSNRLQVFVNGQKKYADTYGFSEILYARSILTIESFVFTNIDTTVTDYNFDIQINGVGIVGSPVYNIALPTSTSPLATTGVDTHGELIATITTLIEALGVLPSPTMDIILNNNAERITSGVQGSTSDIVISNSGSGTYLFDIPTPIPILTFTPSVASPFTDTFIDLAGDQTLLFPVNKNLTIRDTNTDEGVVFDNTNTVQSSTFNGGSPGITTVVLSGGIFTTGIITAHGNVYLTHLGGLVSVTAKAGVDYDYSQTDDAGIDVNKNEQSTQIRFNSVLPASDQVELILFG